MKDIISRFEQLCSGDIHDALRFDLGHTSPFVLDCEIQKVTGRGRTLVGPAFTARGENYRRDRAPTTERRASGFARMLEQVEDSQVLVIDTGRDDVVAHFGDISALSARQAGAVGCVIDGYTRDRDALETLGFRVFARGATPQDAMGDWGIVEHSVPIYIDGAVGVVAINPGDFIFADGDGVLVVPRELLRVILPAAEKRATNEQEMRDALHKGESPLSVHERLGKW